MADKYTQDEIDALGAKGHAFRNPDGHYSYPVDDAEDLDNAIRAVGRGGADHDAIRKYITGRAKAMGLSSKIPDNWNADGSLTSSSSASRAAFDQRKRRRGSMRGRFERRRNSFTASQFELRAKPDGTGGSMYELECYGTVFDNPFEMWDFWGDRYTEVVRPGAFAETLARPDLDTPLLLGHNDMGIPFARTSNGKMQLAEDSHGLHVNAQRLNGTRSDVRDMVAAVGDGDLNEVSIGFITRSQQWSPDYEERALLALDLHRGDVSLVALAANPATKGATMTAMPGESWSASWQPSRRASANSAGDMLHPAFTGTHTHGHPSFSAAEDGQHEHEHDHQGDADHDHHGSGAAGRARPRRHEHRAADDASGEIADVSDAADYNPGAAGGALCVNPQCSVGGAAVTCPQCGGPLYNEDGTIVLDDSGVVEEVGGAMADADLLSRRLRLLELA